MRGEVSDLYSKLLSQGNCSLPRPCARNDVKLSVEPNRLRLSRNWQDALLLRPGFIM